MKYLILPVLVYLASSCGNKILGGDTDDGSGPSETAETCQKENKEYLGDGECGNELPILTLSSPDSLIKCNGFKHREFSEICRFPDFEIAALQQRLSQFSIQYTFDGCYRDSDQIGMVAAIRTEAEQQLILTGGIADRAVTGKAVLRGKGPLTVGKADVFYRTVKINSRCSLTIDSIEIHPISS